MRAPTRPGANGLDFKNQIDAVEIELEANARAAREKVLEIARAVAAGEKGNVSEAVKLVGIEPFKVLVEGLSARAVLSRVRSREAEIENERKAAEARLREADLARSASARAAESRVVAAARRSNDLGRAVRLASDASEGVNEIDQRITDFLSSGALAPPRLEVTTTQAARVLEGNVAAALGPSA